MSILELLWVVFIVLKLAGVISWSWWAVCFPILLEIGIYIILDLSSPNL